MIKKFDKEYATQSTARKHIINTRQSVANFVKYFTKNRSNTAASILQNGDVLRSVYEASQNSEGSAQEELNKYLDSVNGKITQLQNHLQEFAYTAINTDMFKGLIDGANSLLKIIINITDNFGAFTTLLGAASGIFLSKTGFGEMPSNAPLYKVA